MSNRSARGGAESPAGVDRSGDDARDAIMRLNYGQVFRLFADLLGAHPDKSVALTGRLKHFQRAGFPRGTNVGPGSRAAYGMVEVLAIAFAFRLLALRYPPRDAVAAVSGNEGLLLGLALRAWTRRGGRAGADSPDDGPLLVRVAADGLEDLKRRDFDEGPPDRMEAVEQRQVWSWMRGVEPLPGPGLVLVDVEAVVGDTIAALERLELASPLVIAKGFELLRGTLLASGEPVAATWEH